MHLTESLPASRTSYRSHPIRHIRSVPKALEVMNSYERASCLQVRECLIATPAYASQPYGRGKSFQPGFEPSRLEDLANPWPVPVDAVSWHLMHHGCGLRWQIGS